MEFNPNNHIIKLCIQGIELEDKGQPDESVKLFLRAWNEAKDDFEKYLSSYFVARSQKNPADRLKWFETSLNLALKINDDSVKGAFSSLYLNIAKCYGELNDPENSKKNYNLAMIVKDKLTDKGPFYHGTKAEMKIGDLLTPGSRSNYKSEIIMNHVYFTASQYGAGLAAALAKGDGDEHVYIVEPTGCFENDPNVTDRKFPGNPTRSYRTGSPLKIIGEAENWTRQTPDQLQEWSEKLARTNGDIIN
ncbi:MAG TPA: NAD(+)--rifampin ADP-ribosyltransferase [Bacteroidales bacterium]|nr:NAD(+)--rifampin ADP-ribosyltransferase [Bacteroidales bacterium]